MDDKTFVTPKAIAVYPKLVGEPDLYDGKKSWNTKLRQSPEDVEAVRKNIDAAVAAYKAAVEADPKLKPAEKKKILGFSVRYPIKAETDKDGNETGGTLVTYKTDAEFKSKKDGKVYPRAVVFFDAKGKPFKPTSLWGGSEIKVSYKPFVRANSSAEKIDVRLTIQGVQVIKLVAGGNGASAAGCGFQAEEGFEAPQDEAPVEGVDAPPADAEGKDY